MSMGKPNKPKSRRNPEEFQVVMDQTKLCTQDEREIGTGPMTYGDAW
jgi:hypothetical protein